jgi:2-haloacid dehalogenase
MMNITAVIFDFGGVLLKWNPYNILRPYFSDQPHAMETFLKEINFIEWNAHQDKGRSFAEGIEVLSKQFPQYAHIAPAFHEHWEESIDGQIDGSIVLLKTLKANGVPVYGLSNWSSETFPILRKRYDFFDLFDGIILSGEVKMIKPDPAIYYLCLELIQKPAKECLFIDDSGPNIARARQIGFDTVQFESPEQLEEELRSRGLL